MPGPSAIGQRDTYFSAWALYLIPLNLVPLLGVLFLGWSAAQLFLIYWLETLIAGLFLMPRIWLSVAPPAKAYRLMFYCGLVFVILSLFWFVAIALIYVDYKLAQPEAVTETQLSDWLTPGVIWTGLIFAVIYGFILIRDRASGLLARRPIGFDIFAVMGRLVIIQTVISAAAYIILAQDLPLFVTLIMVAGKIMLELLLIVGARIYPALLHLFTGRRG